MKGATAVAACSLVAAAAVAFLSLSPERRAGSPLPPGPRVVPLEPATLGSRSPPARSADDRRHEAISFHEGRPDAPDADRAADPAPEPVMPPRPFVAPEPPREDAR